MGLLKKLKGITTLCGLIAREIIFHNFNGEDKEDQPEVWPYVLEAVDVLKKFKSLPQKKREKNMLNHETLLDKKVEEDDREVE
ncbi:hypothetical protein LINPERHAP2_LOCUS24404 [Linum perenne]